MGDEQDEDDDGDEGSGSEDESTGSRRVDKEHLAVSRRALVAALLDRSDRMWRPSDMDDEEARGGAVSASAKAGAWIRLRALALPCLALPVGATSTAIHGYVPFSGLDLLAATDNWAAVMRVLRMRSECR